MKTSINLKPCVKSTRNTLEKQQKMTQHLSLLSVFLILFVASSSSISAKVVEVNVINKEASKPSNCSYLLNSKPGGANGVDLIHLAEYILDVLDHNMTDTYKLIIQLQSGDNPTIINYYDCCSLDFFNVDTATIRLVDAKLDFQVKHYQAMAKDTADVMKCLLECSNSLKENETSPLLAKYVDHLQQGVQVLQIITKYLIAGK